jgi:AraC-like DNA-binding protein
MVYLERAPNPLLRSWVRTLWYCRAPRAPHRRERVLPNGCMQIILNLSRNYLTDCGEDGKANRRLPRAIVVGTRARYEVVDTADMEEIAGILFQPGGFAGLFRERANLFFERSIALDDVWVGARLTERLSEVATPVERLRALEVLLTQLFRQGTRRSELVDHAIHLFRDRALSVAQCARSVGVSERRLSQVFHEEVGVGPKMWCRIHRFQTAVRALHKGADVPWAELALRCGYYDQSHFANDFRAFSGINPTTYSAHRGRWQNHVPILWFRIFQA